jgi:predicted enzyme related to lactoylglutathione lyase
MKIKGGCMFKPVQSFSGISINDLAAAKQFYAGVLGLEVSEEGPGMRIKHIGGGSVIAYVKDDHQPASYTAFDFEVADIDEAVKSLSEAGVDFERYDGMPQDELGIMRGLRSGDGPDIAWFKDPSGNILAVLQEA